ncbi:MAG: hypothetical protein ACK4QW_12185 [Alphaproteobacteria bacterium]
MKSIADSGPLRVARQLRGAVLALTVLGAALSAGACAAPERAPPPVASAPPVAEALPPAEAAPPPPQPRPQRPRMRPPLPQAKPTEAESVPDSPEAKSAEDPQPLAARLKGMPEAEIERLLGPPARVEEKAPSRIWTYVASDCELRLALFPQMDTLGYRVLSIDFTAGGEPADQAACETALLARTRVSPDGVPRDPAPARRGTGT